MANEYPQYPDAGRPNESGQQGQAGEGQEQGNQSYGPAFGPYDMGATAQQPTRVNQPGQGAHFGTPGVSPAQGGTYQYPAQGAYQAGYRQAQQAGAQQQAQQGAPQPPYPQQGQPTYAPAQQAAPGAAPAQPYGYQQAQRQAAQAQPTQQRQAFQGQPYGYQQAQTHTQAQHQAQTQARPQAATGQGPVDPAAPQLRREQPREGVRVSAAPGRKQRVGLKAVACGLLGGILGSAGVVWALSATGNLGKTTVVTQEGAAGQSISIAANSEDVTIAEAVAAKCLPSVCPVYVESAAGSGMGSGVVLDTDGNILTNYHVAGDASTIMVRIGGKEYEASYVGGDASSDLAVVHAELGGDAVTPIEIGDSEALVVGDWVMTIGSPLGLEQSVSTGIVSSLARSTIQSSTTEGTTLYANLIQTDAVINPGNSGGALVNEEGQLVGIPTLFSSDTGNYAGVGYAIPGNYAIDIANKIIAGEQVTHAYIGLSMQTVNAQNAAANRLSVDYGAYVAQVAEDGPAAAAGIQEGDIITAIGDTKITSASDAILAVRTHSIGETVKVTVMRGSEEKTIDVTLGSDEKLQELQQQQLQQQQQEYYEQYQDYGNGYGNGNGYGYPDDELLRELYEYLYNNR